MNIPLNRLYAMVNGYQNYSTQDASAHIKLEEEVRSLFQKLFNQNPDDLDIINELLNELYSEDAKLDERIRVNALSSLQELLSLVALNSKLKEPVADQLAELLSKYKNPTVTPSKELAIAKLLTELANLVKLNREKFLQILQNSSQPDSSTELKEGGLTVNQTEILDSVQLKSAVLLLQQNLVREVIKEAIAATISKIMTVSANLIKGISENLQQILPLVEEIAKTEPEIALNLLKNLNFLLALQHFNQRKEERANLESSQKILTEFEKFDAKLLAEIQKLSQSIIEIKDIANLPTLAKEVDDKIIQLNRGRTDNNLPIRDIELLLITKFATFSIGELLNILASLPQNSILYRLIRKALGKEPPQTDISI